MRSKKGKVTSTAQNKTIIVTVDTYKNHPKYKKRFKTSKKYHIHNPENKKFEIGEEVTFYETKPISKLKKWTIENPTNTKAI
jgi:small subunit ribosomal protein S17